MTAKSTDKNDIEGPKSVAEDKHPEYTNLTPDSQSVQEQETHNEFEESNLDSGELNLELKRLQSILKRYESRLEHLLSWKEHLKLLTLDANLNTSYYRLWREEANRLFVRCCIIKKRMTALDIVTSEDKDRVTEDDSKQAG